MLGKDFDRISIQNKETEGFYESVRFYLTSLKNSPGMAFDNWKDGTPLQIITTENSHTFYNIQPEQYKYLKNNGKCQPESFYECIASKLDEIEFKGCSKKCMPNIFSNIGIMNYRTPFCQNDTENEKCAMQIGKNIIHHSNCKKSCSNLVYTGEISSSIIQYQKFLQEKTVKIMGYHFKGTNIISSKFGMFCLFFCAKSCF